MENKSLFELVDELNLIYKNFAGDKLSHIRQGLMDKSTNGYLTIFLDNWSSKEKELLLIEGLKGIHYFMTNIPKGKVFPHFNTMKY